MFGALIGYFVSSVSKLEIEMMTHIDYVIDFCPICRDVKIFKINRVYFCVEQGAVSFRSNSISRCQKVCVDCGVILDVVLNRYQEILPQNEGDVITLLEKTFPNIYDVFEERFALEKMVRERPIGIPENMKEDLIQEPFLLLAGIVGDRRPFQLDWASGTGCLLTLFLPFSVPWIMMLFVSHSLYNLQVAGLVFVVCLFVTVCLILSTPGKLLKRKILPNLIRSLRPLRPTEEELGSCLGRLEDMGLKIAMMSKTKKLHDLVYLVYNEDRNKTPHIVDDTCLSGDFSEFQIFSTASNCNLIQLERVGFERMSYEKSIRNDMIKRAKSIKDIFQEISEKFDICCTNGLNYKSGLGCLVTIVLPLMVLCYFESSGNDSISPFIFFLVILVGIMMTLYLFFAESGKRVEREILPDLADALRCLRPTEEELEDCLRRLRTMKLKIGRKINVKKLLKLINDG